MDEFFKGLNTHRGVSVYNCVITKGKICTDMFLWHCIRLLLIQEYLYVEQFQGRLAGKCEDFPY